MALNVGLSEVDRPDGDPPFIYLDDFVVSLENETAFKKNCSDGIVYKVVRTEDNDRSRSRRSSRKSTDLSQILQSTHSSFFAHREDDFARLWYESNGW